MVEEAETKESRGSRRGVSGGSFRKQRSRAMVFLLLAVCRVAGVITGAYLGYQRADSVSRQGLAYEANVASDDVPGKTKEQRQKELGGVAEEGMLAISISVTPFGKALGTGYSVNQMIEGPSNQEKLVYVEITCDDIGKKIFEIRAIYPGNYLESGPLFIPFPIGEYNYTIVFLVYQEETEVLIGQAVVKIKLVLRE